MLLKGLWIGATMTVPGVSGGTMAVIAGIYERLIHALNHLTKNPTKHIPFLLLFVVGAGTGFIVFARGITYLLQNPRTDTITRFFFCGIVAGGIGLLVKKAEVKKIKITNIIAIISGVVVVILLSAIPAQGILAGKGIAAILIQIVVGFLIAIALILPGISVTHMLYLFGLYEPVLSHVYQREFLALLPLAAGVLIGIFLVSKVLERLFEKYTTNVYLIILGFVAASVWSLLPRELNQFPWIGILAFGIGFGISYGVTKWGEGRENVLDQ